MWCENSKAGVQNERAHHKTIIYKKIMFHFFPLILLTTIFLQIFIPIITFTCHALVPVEYFTTSHPTNPLNKTHRYNDKTSSFMDKREIIFLRFYVGE
jgi:hypothetical protein